MAKEWYDKNIWLNILWMISGILWLPIYGVCKVVEFIDRLGGPVHWRTPKWVRWWGNRVDNLVDQFKEYIHCHNIPYKDYHINISRWMNNRTTFGDLIRPRRDPDGNCWSNCDPEDCPGNECNCPK
jgi:hypothetical protein